MQLVRISEYIGEAISRKEAISFLSIDISKAFDKIYHTGLIYKLIKINISPKLIILLRNYLRYRSFTVRVNSDISTPRPIQASIAQGSNLGPTLFLLYMYDLPNRQEDPNFIICQFADDTALIQRFRDANLAIQKLQDKMPELEEWMAKWKMKVNTSKSKLLVIRKLKKNKRITNNLYLFDEIVPKVDKLNYLGVIYNSKFNWDDNVENSLRKAKAAVQRISTLLNPHNNLNIFRKRQLILMILRPILTYASPCWANINKTQMLRLSGYIHRILKRAINAPRYIRNVNLYKDPNAPMLPDFIDKCNLKFFLKHTENESILCKHLTYHRCIEDKKIKPLIATASKHSELYDKLFANFGLFMHSLNLPW